MRVRSTLQALATLLLAVPGPLLAAGHLEISQAWIRTPPPGAMMLGGYAVLRNTGDAAVVVIGAASDDFGSISLHESTHESGVERMRPLGKLAIEPGGSVTFAPGGKHLMLMQPKRPLRAGDKVAIGFATDPPGSAMAGFVVGDSAR